jgi:hypothetical protein
VGSERADLLQAGPHAGCRLLTVVGAALTPAALAAMPPQVRAGLRDCNSGDVQRRGAKHRRAAANLKFTGLTHNFPVDPAV